MRQAVALAALLAATCAAQAQQPPDIGAAPTELSEPSYTFDTAEQHRVKVTPLVRGLGRPFALELLPGGDLLVTMRGGDLDRFPAWKGNLFVGSGRRGEVPGTGGIERVVLGANFGEVRRETLLTELHQGVRDIMQAPDGLIYVLTDGNENAVLRIEPAE